MHLEEALRSSRMAVVSAPMCFFIESLVQDVFFNFKIHKIRERCLQNSRNNLNQNPPKKWGSSPGFPVSMFYAHHPSSGSCSAEVVKPRHAACGQAEQHVDRMVYGKRHESQLFWGEPWGGFMAFESCLIPR